MDERKTIIRELEDKKRADINARNRLLEELGEILIDRIGEENPFQELGGDNPGAILAEYRKLRKEISDSRDMIGALEADIQRLKELEQVFASKENEKLRLERELAGIQNRIGKAILAASLAAPGLEDLLGPLKRQEENLRARIEEQEERLRELEKEREGGILNWLGKNAQTAVSRTILVKNQSTLERVYLAAGEKFLSIDSADSVDSAPVPEGEAAGDVENARELKDRLSSLITDLSGLKGERRQIGDRFGAGGAPTRRIQGLEKRVAFVNEEFPAVYLRFGALAADSGGREALSAILVEEDNRILEKAEFLKAGIEERELAIQKIRAAISIDNEKAEIERKNKAIQNQQQRIAAASNAISGLEKQITESEKRIAELEEFLRDNG